MKPLRFRFCILLACAIIAVCAVVAHAQVPQTIQYQGYLVTAGGTPVDSNSTPIQLTFRLYDGPAPSGNLIWTEVHPGVTVTNGSFTVLLGSITPFSAGTPVALAFDRPYFLGVEVNQDEEMTPRQPLSASPYALRAAAADAVGAGVRIGVDNTLPCDGSRGGSVRWNTGLLAVEVCDGAAWRPMAIGVGSFTVGGTVSGLVGTVTLQNNGSTLALSANGSFQLPTPVANGGAYSVAVLTQPVGQSCMVGNGSGTIAGANVGSVAVSCTMVPPTVNILPPTANLIVGPGLPVFVQVHAQSASPVTQVVLETSGALVSSNSVPVVPPANDTTITVRLDLAAGLAQGATIQLDAHAINQLNASGPATPVTLTTDVGVAASAVPGLVASVLATGNINQLAGPRSIARSPVDGQLYVADVEGSGPCAPSCIWKVDPVTGAIAAGPVYQGTGQIEGLAFDASGANLYLSDRQNRVVRLTWNGTAYAGPGACVDVAAQSPRDPYHLIVDSVLGLLVADGNTQGIERVATCTPSTVGTLFTQSALLDSPRGMEQGPSGELYVSDFAGDTIKKIDRATGAAMTYSNTGMSGPYGVQWLAGASAWSNSLLVANFGSKTLVAVTGGATPATLPVVYFRNRPIDLALSAGSAYVVAAPVAGEAGRILKISGF